MERAILIFVGISLIFILFLVAFVKYLKWVNDTQQYQS